DYLRARGYVTGEIEELELEELQGVQGLRALRVAVDLSAPDVEARAAFGEAVAGVPTLRQQRAGKDPDPSASPATADRSAPRPGLARVPEDLWDSAPRAVGPQPRDARRRA